MNRKETLNITIAGTWSTYAGSMMSILNNCGMWDSDRSLADFMGMTGIAFQFIVHKACASSSVTAYDWESDHPSFLKRIGVKTDFCFSVPSQSDYQNVCKIAEKEIKDSIHAGRGVVLWGIDTGEFGIVSGYDDDEKIFYVSGIGSSDGVTSSPILYSNLGRTFQPAPIMYCHYPISYEPRKEHDIFADSLTFYVRYMRESNIRGDFDQGLAAYDYWIHAMNTDFQPFGLRYITGVYTERKILTYQYFEGHNKYLSPDFIEIWDNIQVIFRKIHFDILEQNFNGWNHLHKSVSKTQAKAVQNLLSQAKILEERALQLAI
ncbi:hypothetical protein [Paenibacillus ginsengarvi]|uniref:Uncharacterized protein n=1 Tax=Paenibacillus ginsengarvi TaxID=400777 RepID=A0A3B0C0K2_9BACL|nr:hypothetical protein [Paenibacillus ginsengarvi]RKN79203.1 hypothetical protein D7M11_21210 [Paenibacillus ginsengarvi]